MKRSRTGRDVGGDVADLLATPVGSAPWCDDPSEVAWSAPRPAPDVCIAAELSLTATPPVKRVRASQSPSSAGVSSPTARSSASSASARTAGDSVGGAELDLLRRKDEEVADMAVFLAQAAAETASHASVGELVAFFERIGVTRVALALRRAGAMAVFVERLCSVRPTALRRVALRLLLCLTPHAETEALFQECVVAFLVDSLASDDGSEAAPPPMAQSPTSGTAHWSQRRKTAAAPQSSPLPGSDGAADSLEARAASLCTSATPPNVDGPAGGCAALSMSVLLALVFAHDDGSAYLAAHHGTSVPLAFTRLGGLERLGRLLASPDAKGSALAVLEVLTATPTLSREADRLLALVPALVAQTRDRAAQVPALRVLTNITNVLPHALRATHTTALFAEFALDVLASATPPQAGSHADVELFALCCAINVVRNESTGSPSDAAAELAPALAAAPESLEAFATAMVQGYGGSDTELLVRSGYYALLLSALSLAPAVVDGQPTTLRVPVMTAVAKASSGTRLGRTARHQPMRLVVAIVQELLLFQSSAGTLTKETLLATSALVERVTRSNQIEVAADDGSGEGYDDDDDVALAELL